MKKAQEKYPNLLIGIGASAGGLRAIVDIIDWLPEHFQATIIVATHRSPDAPNLLGTVLQKYTRLHVQEPVEGTGLSCTHIYVSKPGESLTVEDGKFKVGLDPERLRRFQRIDDVFLSIAETAGSNAVGVVLSGMLWDGVKGLQAIQKAGGTCLVQDPDDAQFQSMPRHALESVDGVYKGTTIEIASRLIELAIERQCR